MHPQHENELAGSPLIPRQSETRLRLSEAGFAFQRDSSSPPCWRTCSKTSRPKAVPAAPAEIVTTTISRASVPGSTDSTTPCSNTGTVLSPTPRPRNPSAPPAIALACGEPRTTNATPTSAKTNSFAAATHFPPEE